MGRDMGERSRNTREAEMQRGRETKKRRKREI